MTVSLVQLQDYVGTKETGAFMDNILSTAKALVARYIGSAQVPGNIIDQAVLTVASELFHRRSAPFGQAQFSDMGASVRASLDPMRSTYALLLPYVGYAV